MVSLIKLMTEKPHKLLTPGLFIVLILCMGGCKAFSTHTDMHEHMIKNTPIKEIRYKSIIWNLFTDHGATMIGETIYVNTTTAHSNFDHIDINNGGTSDTTTIDNDGWHTTGNPNPFTPGVGIPLTPTPGGGITVSSPYSSTSGLVFTDPVETDEKGAQVIRSKAPSINDILVEIGKVIAKNGDILEIRELLQKNKIKLVDHDGEVVFDPAWRKDLKEKDF